MPTIVQADKIEHDHHGSAGRREEREGYTHTCERPCLCARVFTCVLVRRTQRLQHPCKVPTGVCLFCCVPVLFELLVAPCFMVNTPRLLLVGTPRGGDGREVSALFTDSFGGG